MSVLDVGIPGSVSTFGEDEVEVAKHPGTRPNPLSSASEVWSRIRSQNSENNRQIRILPG